MHEIIVRELRYLLEGYVKGSPSIEKSQEIQKLVMKLERIFNSLYERRKVMVLRIFGSEKISTELNQVRVSLVSIKNLVSGMPISIENARTAKGNLVILEGMVEDIYRIEELARKSLFKDLKEARKEARDLTKVA